MCGYDSIKPIGQKAYYFKPLMCGYNVAAIPSIARCSLQTPIRWRRRFYRSLQILGCLFNPSWVETTVHLPRRYAVNYF